MNGETKLETPALISAIVQDVQGVKKQENQDTKEPKYQQVEILSVPRLQRSDEEIGKIPVLINNDADIFKPSEDLQNNEKRIMQMEMESQVSVELGMDLDKVEEFVLSNQQHVNFSQKQTPFTVPVPNGSPGSGDPVPVSHVPAITTTDIPLLDSKSAEPAMNKNGENISNAEEGVVISPWSREVVEDQPVVYMPPPVVQTECDEELEELANVGRTVRQPAIGSNHHLSAMFEHHHHEKTVRDLPFDSEPLRHDGDEISSRKVDRDLVEPAEANVRLYRVPSVLEQLVDEPLPEVEENRPIFRVPSVLEQMMDEPPAVIATNASNPPEVDEYRLDSAEIASERQEGSSQSPPAIHVPGSAMAVTTCRDLQLRDSEAGFMLGDTEAVPAAGGISSFSERSAKKSKDSSSDFPVDEEQFQDSGSHAQVADIVVREKNVMDEEKINITSVDANRQCDPKENNSANSIAGAMDKVCTVPPLNDESVNIVRFLVGEPDEEVSESVEAPLMKHTNSEIILNTEMQQDNLSGDKKLTQNKTESKFDNIIGEEVNATSCPVELRIPSLNELFSNEDSEGFPQDLPAEAFAYWTQDDEPCNGLRYDDLGTSDDAHAMQEALRPKPPPGRSERGCISARYVNDTFWLVMIVHSQK